jgi:hypothetical protein
MWKIREWYSCSLFGVERVYRIFFEMWIFWIFVIVIKEFTLREWIRGEAHAVRDLRIQERLSFASANRYKTPVKYDQNNMGQMQKNELVLFKCIKI